MKRLYKYTGTVESMSYRPRPGTLPSVDLVLSDLWNDDKAPVAITAMGGLADYINAIQWTDAEERYISANWYYDRTLCLHHIEIPSADPSRPAKIIAQHEFNDPTVSVYGPTGYVETRKPKPMSDEQLTAWYSFQSLDEYRE